jgi:hypothetical protein
MVTPSGDLPGETEENHGNVIPIENLSNKNP